MGADGGRPSGTGRKRIFHCARVRPLVVVETDTTICRKKGSFKVVYLLSPACFDYD